MIKYKMSILVLLYAKEVELSSSINSLISLSVDLSECKLVVWNNGPKELERKDLIIPNGLSVEFIETIENESLSKIYNRFLCSGNSLKYLILDDDSEVSEEYILHVITSTSKLVVPIVYHNSMAISPLKEGRVLTTPAQYCNKDNIIAIGSGLAISNELAFIMNNYFGTVFDERFYFYGVDTTFMFRFNLLEGYFDLNIANYLGHSLSSLEKEAHIVTDFRRKESSYSEGLKLKYYTSPLKAYFTLFRYLVSIFYRKVSGRNHRLNSTDLIKAFISGRHYKNKA